MLPMIDIFMHADAAWLSPALADSWAAALRALLPELLQQPPGPAHVLSGLDQVEISIVDDPTIARVHADFLNDPTATDVITFPYGEILVSCDTAATYAARHGLNREEELFRYMVHGLVHLHGYLDATPEQRAALFAVQEPLVSRFFPQN
ncbi:MAG: rRNA maturation RNase YbeY [Akkermansiaceae bacterium]|nr:rRNA maturation RNase YbeY [Akkermansiaceae bacterium]